MIKKTAKPKLFQVEILASVKGKIVINSYDMKNIKAQKQWWNYVKYRIGSIVINDEAYLNFFFTLNLLKCLLVHLPFVITHLMNGRVRFNIALQNLGSLAPTILSFVLLYWEATWLFFVVVVALLVVVFSSDF